MKIAHVLWSPKIGGAELFALRLAREQAREHDVTILYLGASDEEIDGIWSDGVEVACFRARNGYDFSSFINLVSHLRMKQYEVIHQHQTPSVLPFIRLGARSASIIKHEHGRASVASRSRRQRYVGSITKRFVDAYIANSNYTKEQIVLSEGVRPQKIKVVKGGVDLSAFELQNASPSFREELKLGDTPLVLFLGRLVWEKGIDDFLDVAFRVARKLPETRFIIAGDGPLRETVLEKIDQLGLGDKTHVLGFRQDVPRIMSACNVFLMTSRKEAQGLTVLEAMASGLPVISFDAGGLPEVLGEAGFLVKNRSVEEMSAMTIKLLEDESLRRSTVEKSLEYVGQYSFPEVARNVMAIYQSGI